MRLIATVLNIASIGIVIYILFSIKYLKGETLMIFFSFLVASITSLLAFSVEDGQNWLSLFLQRKTLEERKKIERLNSEEI